MELKSLPDLVPGDPVKASGTSSVYRERTQLIIDGIEKITHEVDPRQLYPSSAIPENRLREEFSHRVSGLKEPLLRALFREIEKESSLMDAFFTAPAAITMHHARIGGLAEHSLAVCRFAEAVADIHTWLNRDLLNAGCLLHDIGKIREYEMVGDFRYTLEGKLLGHIILGVEMVREWINSVPGFPNRIAMDLLHIILSHHGELEYGSPKVPSTPEALVVHYADDLDAKMDMVKTASADPDASESYVRGMRRSFLFDRGESSSPEFETGQDASPAAPGKGDEDQRKLF
jgi:3'-5' exoribonuclease